MCDGTEIVRDVQRVIREQLDTRGIALKVVSAKAGIPYTTLCTYFPGNERGAFKREPVQLPAGALYNLCGAIPDDLLNLLMPEGYAVVRVPAGLDYDDMAQGCRAFLETKDKAHHPESEAGRDIGPTEHSHLSSKVVQLRGRIA
jgi:hypothetical protein